MTEPNITDAKPRPNLTRALICAGAAALCFIVSDVLDVWPVGILTVASTAAAGVFVARAMLAREF